MTSKLIDIMCNKLSAVFEQKQLLRTFQTYLNSILHLSNQPLEVCAAELASFTRLFQIMEILSLKVKFCNVLLLDLTLHCKLSVV